MAQGERKERTCEPAHSWSHAVPAGGAGGDVTADGGPPWSGDGGADPAVDSPPEIRVSDGERRPDHHHLRYRRAGERGREHALTRRSGALGLDRQLRRAAIADRVRL